jgi:uncharacterized protein with gpF-like domain
MDSINEWLQSEAIAHQVDLQKYSNQIVRRMMQILSETDKRLYAELTAALERLDPASFTVERLESLLSSVKAVNTDAYKKVGDDLQLELRDYVKYEASYQQQALVNVLPVQVHVAAINVEQVYTAAMARPFQGVLLKGVLDDMKDTTAKKIRNAIAQGFVEGKTTAQIIRELRGTKINGYADGLMQRSRRDIEAVTRTALGHMAQFTQNRLVDANQDIIKCVVWCATLDTRTSPPCRARDGKQYTTVEHQPIGHSFHWGGGPGGYHWRCRSHQTTVLKSNKELGIDVPDVVMKDGTRASMDGQLPKDVTYSEWIQKQSSARQDEVLGATRAQLMREGKMRFEDMYGSKGQYLTLDELYKKL